MPRRVSANEFHVVNGEDYTYVKVGLAPMDRTEQWAGPWLILSSSVMGGSLIIDCKCDLVDRSRLAACFKAFT